MNLLFVRAILWIPGSCRPAVLFISLHTSLRPPAESFPVHFFRACFVSFALAVLLSHPTKCRSLTGALTQTARQLPMSCSTSSAPPEDTELPEGSAMDHEISDSQSPAVSTLNLWHLSMATHSWAVPDFP